jgi:HD superfamily phosphohydrolase
LEINKKKIINDPIYGFISIHSELVFDLIEHPFVQRLRRIKQLGLSSLVFPGANHTRFEHAIGAVHLMRQTIYSLRNKEVIISDEEAEAAVIAILLHDIGHGPFSHVLERTLVDIPHEDVSLFFMEELNRQFQGRLSLAIEIFRNRYHRKFLCQLIAGQIDIDRLDYLGRDSFYTGVTDGQVGVERIIKMLNVHNENLVVEMKAIYSIEKFLIARRYMYWQVYLHKTVVSAELLLVSILNRAKELAQSGDDLFSSPSLKFFLAIKPNPLLFIKDHFFEGHKILSHFSMLDDNDILNSIKVWQEHPDTILSFLSKCLINRKLFKVKFCDQPFSEKKIDKLKREIKTYFKVTEDEVKYFLIHQEITNSAYNAEIDNIRMITGKGNIMDFNEASDLNLSALSTVVRKFFLCYPKELDIN